MLKNSLHYHFLLLFFFLTACNSLKMAPYDQYSYQKAIEIKLEAGKLMDKATSSFNENTGAIENLKDEITKMVEYEQYRPNNEISFQMWQILNDSEKNLLAGFLKRWEEKGTLSPFFITEAKNQITEAFNLLIQFEGKKDPAVKNQLLELITKN